MQWIELESSQQMPLYGWYLAAKTKSRGIVVQLHGNAQNMSSHFLSLAWLTQYGYDLVTFDYRGYGLSAGKPTTAGVRDDTIKLLTWVQTYASTHHLPVYIYGQSLGASIAVDALASLKEHQWVRALILESAFWSYPRIAREKLASFWLTWPLQWLAYLSVNPRHSIAVHLAQIQDLPLLIIHSQDDKIVPHPHGVTIDAHATNPQKCFWSLPHAPHVGAMQVEQGRYRQSLVDYLTTGICTAQHD